MTQLSGWVISLGVRLISFRCLCPTSLPVEMAVLGREAEDKALPGRKVVANIDFVRRFIDCSGDNIYTFTSTGNQSG
jgi:hypothetical protein